MENSVYESMYHQEKTHWWFCARRAIVQEVLNQLFLPSKNPTLLEVGCGSGGNFDLLKNYGDLYGMEMSEKAIEYAKKNGFEKIRKGKLPKQIAFAKQEFDLILALDVIEHVEEDKESFHALYHSLKKNGFLVFTVPAYSFLWSSHDTMHHHKRRYTKKTLTNIIDPNQYSIEYLSYFQFFLFPLLCVDRMIFDKLSFLKSKNQNHSKKDPKEEIPSFLINRLFQMIFSFESRFIGKKHFPFGSSILGILKKL